MPALSSPTSRRDQTRRAPIRSKRPTLEGLEDRYLLSSLEGGQWTYGSRITYSFMPDGTNVGGVPSSLFQTMNTYSTTTAWEQAIEKAAAIWQVVANINLVQVSDNGEPEGAAGNQQGDPNVGDIRIGAIPMQGGQLAFTLLPPPINGGTNAGDMFFNSQQVWGSQGYDLETVAIHEFGHALGLGESAVQQAVMYTYYTGVKTTLATDDISAIQSLYGAVPNPTANASTATATNLNSGTNNAANLSSGIISSRQFAVSGVNIASSSSSEWYAVTVPAGTTGTMTVTMQSSNISSLSPRVTVFNGQVVGLGQALAANTYGATVSYTVNNVTPGQVYYIRASAANTGPGSVGSYGLLVNFGSHPQAASAPPNTLVASQADQGSGSEAELVAGPSSPSDLAGGGWWSNWVSSWQNGGSNSPGSSGLALFQLGSHLAWGEGLSLATPTGGTAQNLPTGGTGSLAGNLADSFLTIIAPLISEPSASGIGTLDLSGDGSSDPILSILDLILAEWNSGQNNSGNVSA